MYYLLFPHSNEFMRLVQSVCLSSPVSVYLPVSRICKKNCRQVFGEEVQEESIWFLANMSSRSHSLYAIAICL